LPDERTPTISFHLDLDWTGAGGQNDVAAGNAGLKQGVGGSQSSVTGVAHLARRREDTDAAVSAHDVRRKDEGSARRPQFGGDARQLFLGEAASLENHNSRIPTEGHGRKRVDVHNRNCTPGGYDGSHHA
jgi:hypothetical protein